MEFFTDSGQADLYGQAIDQVEYLIVPVISIYEVVKKLTRDAGEDIATSAMLLMQRGEVVPIDLPLALAAAANGLPMADSLIYATAQQHDAVLWTQDAHFEGLPGVVYRPKLS